MGQVYQKQVSHTPKPSCVHPLSHLHHLSSRPALTSSTADPQPHQLLLTWQGQRVSTEEDQTLVFQESSSTRLLISKAVPQAFTTWCHMSTAGLESCSQRPDRLLHFTSHLLPPRAGQKKVSCLSGAYTSINIKSRCSTAWKTASSPQTKLSQVQF